MEKGRLEAFSDGVVAIIITIMVLDMRAPAGADAKAALASAPVFLTYALSYLNIGVFWTNHHHMLAAVRRVDGRTLLANLFFLFWLSVVPFDIRWIDETRFAPLPVAAYGVSLALAAVGYTLVQQALIACNGPTSRLADAVGRDTKGKLSLAGFLVAAPLAFVSVWISLAIYVAVVGAWLIPDRRIERPGDGA